MKFNTSKKIYLHIDCDSFFAWCELLKNPKLKGKCVCVWHEIILACSYEAKKLWIYTWMPVWEASRKLKSNWIFLKPDMHYYSEISIWFIDFLKNNTYNVEQFSIDEAFCEITWLPEYFKINLDNYLIYLQKKIYNELWISVSIWCSNTKIKAKIYSKLNKPFWIFNWFNEDEKEVFKKLELKLIPFIWRKTQEKLKYKCKTIYDYLSFWYWNLDNLIWKTATDLWLELAWIDVFKVQKSNEVKSFSRSRSFNDKITNDKNFLKKELLKNFEYVFKELYVKNFLVKKVWILLRDREFNTYHLDIILNDYTNERKKILQIIYNLFESSYSDCLEYRSTWIYFSDFKSFLPRQLSIFDVQNLSTMNNFTLNKTIINLNQKYWDNILTYGTTLLETKKLKTRFI